LANDGFGIKAVGFSYITPGKNHYKQDKEKVENF
jgi:hypothetical protein